jgi:hypothetical protein
MMSERDSRGKPSTSLSSGQRLKLQVISRKKSIVHVSLMNFISKMTLPGISLDLRLSVHFVH